MKKILGIIILLLIVLGGYWWWTTNLTAPITPASSVATPTATVLPTVTSAVSSTTPAPTRKPTATALPTTTSIVPSTIPAPVRKLQFIAPTATDIIKAGQTVYFGWTSAYTSSVRDRGDLFLYRADETKVTRPNPTWGGDSKNFFLTNMPVVSGNFITRTDLPAGQYKFVLIGNDGNRYDSAFFFVR